MDWISALSRSIAYMEEHLTDSVTAQDVAGQMYISPLYLQKGFQILTGITMTEYLRNRRLYLAALEVLETQEKIMDIGLKYGYDTPESFSKAFTRFHGVSPMQMRKEHSAPHIFLPLKINITIQGGNCEMKTELNMTISPMNAFRVIGFVREFSYDTAVSYAEIPKFWDEISRKYMMSVFSTGKPANAYEKAVMENRIGEYGVCLDDIGGGKFRYMIGGKYTGGEVPEGMEVVELPASEWAKFECTGAIPQALQEVNTKVFKEWLPNHSEYEMSAPVNVEWYSSDGKQSDADYRSAIWVPLKKVAL